MAKYTRCDKQRLAPEIIAKFHDAGQRGDLEAFKRLLAEFKRNADALRRALREKK